MPEQRDLCSFSRREFILLAALGAVGMFTTGCSGIANESPLTSTTWIDVLLGEEKVTFSADGTVHIGDDSYPWKQDGEKIVVTKTTNNSVTGVESEKELTYELGEQDGYKTLSDLTDEAKAFYVPEDKLDTAREYIKSHADPVDFDQLTADRISNMARAKSTYEGKFCITSITVRAIESNCARCSHKLLDDELYNGLPLNSVSIYLPSEALMQLNKGDKIIVCGLVTVGHYPSMIGFLC